MRRSPLVTGLVIASFLIICGGLALLGLSAFVLMAGVQSPHSTSTLQVIGHPPLAAPVLVPTNTQTPVFPTPSPSPGEREREMAATLTAITISPRDPVALAIALRGVDPEDLLLPSDVIPREYHIGDTEQFWITNNDTRQSRQIEAELIAETAHVYMWLDTTASPRVAGGQPAGPEDFLAAAESFEESYRLLRDVFGEEPSPGVDGDVHLFVLNSGDLGAVGGFFSADDQLSPIVNPMSNAHEMFYVSTWGAGSINESYYNKTLAHEFQHMIHYSLDPNEDTWLNEGMAELAQQLAGLSGEDWVSDYLSNTEIQLTAWPPEEDTTPYYGGNFLFAEYLYERFGVDFIASLVRDPRNGLLSLDAALADAGYDGDTDNILDDWSVAVALDDPSFAGGRYGFENVALDGPTPATLMYLPWTHESHLNQYGFDYIRTYEEGPILFTFEGSQIAPIVPVEPHSGEWMWWSNFGDYSMMTLTREFDLGGVDQATLTFWTWYNIEFEWDYAYVMVSTDGGRTWDTLRTPISTDHDPTGNNFGNGITGASEGWIQIASDLNDYAGRIIQLRFALISDDSAHLENMVIDDVAIPEIGFFDDAEAGDGGWVADGFVRIINRLPQSWSVQAVVLSSPPQIYPMAIGDDNTGSLYLDIPPEANGAYVIVSPRTRNTLMPAWYRIDMTEP